MQKGLVKKVLNTDGGQELAVIVNLVPFPIVKLG